TRQALAGFVGAGMPGRAAQLLPRAVQELRARSFTAQADALQAEADQRLAALPGLNVPTLQRSPLRGLRNVQRRTGNLPAHCPQCGSPLHPDEVEWLDERTAECEYCGSVVRAA
ncbi:MAG: hypothetical protein HY784_12865, partial [Chloroflexi bacterium]|nr:hypothetical protein [Chloroflexota bacterium]